MKEQFIFYGVCFAISFAAVAITSLVKLIVCGIARKCGKDLSGNAKEYIFTPLAIILAAAGVFVWLDKFCQIAFDEKFILTVVCFGVGTMLVYLLLFQPTRKFAVKIVKALLKHVKVPDVVETVKNTLAEAEITFTLSDEKLQSNAEQNDGVLLTVAEKPPERESETDAAADKLRAMVEVIKNNKSELSN